MLVRLLSKMNGERFSNIAISVTDEGRLGRPLRDLGVPVHALEMRRGTLDPAGLWRLTRLLRQERPDLVQTWLYHSDLLGLIASRLTGVPRLAWNIRCSETDERYRTGLRGVLVRILSRLSAWPDVVIANSSAGVASHRRIGYHPRRWEMIPNGIDVDCFHEDAEARIDVRRELGLDQDCILVGLVARFDPLKDHPTFLRAAARLVQNGNDVRFVLIGAGMDSQNQELTQLIDTMGLAGRVFLLGERNDIPRLDAALDIGVCSSTGEGFPNMIAETMACGVPCVTTDVGDAAELVGASGISVPARDPDAMAAAFRELLDAGVEGRRQRGEAARRQIAGHFDLATMVSRYEALYTELVEVAGPATPQ